MKIYVLVIVMETLQTKLPILINFEFSNFPSVSSQLGVVNAITIKTNATAVHIAAAFPFRVLPIVSVIQ